MTIQIITTSIPVSILVLISTVVITQIFINIVNKIFKRYNFLNNFLSNTNLTSIPNLNQYCDIYKIPNWLAYNPGAITNGKHAPSITKIRFRAFLWAIRTFYV